jgi:hypothetical protein
MYSKCYNSEKILLVSVSEMQCAAGINYVLLGRDGIAVCDDYKQLYYISNSCIDGLGVGTSAPVKSFKVKLWETSGGRP